MPNSSLILKTMVFLFSIPWLANAGIKPDLSIFARAAKEHFQPVSQTDMRELLAAVEAMKKSMEQNPSAALGQEYAFYSTEQEKTRQDQERLRLVLNNLASMGIKP